jgi:hypothetical protein
VNNITRLVVKNQLPFIVADKMASLLFKMKSERMYQNQVKKSDYTDTEYQGEGYSITLKKAEIAAAAKLACAYLGIQKEITFDRDVSNAEIMKYEEELTNI